MLSTLEERWDRESERRGIEYPKKISENETSQRETNK
jgi:hypothetical protein